MWLAEKTGPFVREGRFWDRRRVRRRMPGLWGFSAWDEGSLLVT